MARDARYSSDGIRESHPKDRRSGVDSGVDGNQGGVWVDGEGGTTTDRQSVESSGGRRGINLGSEVRTDNFSASRCDGNGDHNH